MKKLLTVIMLAMTAISIYAQPSSHRLSADNPINLYHIRTITQDKTGFIWMGSGSGLYRYDGYHYQRIREVKQHQLLPDESVQNIENWGNRYLWIRLRGNLYSCYDVDLGNFVEWNGKQTNSKSYQKYTIIDQQNLWLYDNEHGCCHVQSHADGTISSHTYSMQDGTLPSNGIRFIIHAQDGTAWIGTDKGLASIRKEKSSILLQDQDFACAQRMGAQIFFLTRQGAIYRTSPTGIASEYDGSGCHHQVRDVVCESGQLVITTDGPTLCYDPSDKQLIQHPRINITQAQIVSDRQGNKIIFDHEGTAFWYITPMKTYHFTDIYGHELTRQNAGGRFRFVYDKQDRIWISTYGNGLHAYDTQKGIMNHYHADSGVESLIVSDYLLNIFEDKSGQLWVCQENQGVRVIDKAKRPIDMHYFTTPSDYGHANNVRLIQRAGNQIFLGNRLNNLWTADRQLQNLQKDNPYDDDVVAVASDAQGRLWVGTRNKGVFVNGQHLGAIMKGKVSSILCDQQGRTWISMFDGGVELVTTNHDGSMTVRSFFKGSHSITQPRSMLQDHQGRIWLSSSKGVYLFSPDRLLQDPSAYSHIHVCGNDMNSDEVHCLYEDSNHHIWAGTTGYGLVQMNGQGEVVKRYTTKDGLPNDRVESVVEDKDGYLWVGTDYGLGRLDKQRKRIHSFFLSNSELGMMYTEGCALRLDDGRLAMGTLHGMQVFTPQSVKPAANIFPLAITSLYVNGTPLQDISDEYPSLSPLTAQTLKFSHEQNSLTFHFSDFEYAGNRNASFSYLLEGFDDEWSQLSTMNFATYKNLPPGNYTLRVRSFNINGTQNDHEAVLSIVIRQPWWNTWWAWLINMLIVGSICWIIWRQWRHTEELRTKIKIENQLTDFKLRFFTNISHEFRTPLTIIRGAMDHIAMQGDIPGKLRQPISSMQKSTDRMLRLINELLEFRKIQNQQLSLQLEETNIVDFLRNIFLTFNETAENRQMSYQFNTFAREYNMFIDRNYVDKMAYNLLSNAFKYTTRRQSITMRVRLTDDQRLAFEVEDTGIGVAKEKQGDLFTRFNQSAFSRDSIGIGLHMVSELVRVHHGDIRFQENPAGQGSIFTISLPTDKRVYSEADFLVSNGNKLLTDEEASTSNSPLPIANYKELAAPPLNDRTILVVDDDDDMREHIASELRSFFVIETACNGEEALQKIQEQRPDLIVSDVRMPGMNGFELTRKIRQDKELSDLPIILLTAITDEEKMVKGTENGADDYLYKPFNTKVLIAKCSTLIGQRDRLRVKYAKEVVGSTPIADIIVEDADKKFQERFEGWVYAHISDPNMQVLDFANNMKMGRTTFFKKVKQVTGMPPHEFVKKARMLHAAELLKDPTLTISEVSYQTGFEDPNYFSRNFKEYFGMTASQFRKGKTPATS